MLGQEDYKTTRSGYEDVPSRLASNAVLQAWDLRWLVVAVLAFALAMLWIESTIPVQERNDSRYFFGAPPHVGSQPMSSVLTEDELRASDPKAGTR